MAKRQRAPEKRAAKPKREPAERKKREPARRKAEPARARELDRRLIVGGLIAAPILFGIVFFFAFVRFVYPKRVQSEPAGEGLRHVRYVVPREASAEGVATDLAELHIVDSPFLFASYLRLMDADELFRRGEVVELLFGATPEQIARRLATGLGPVAKRVTLPEGLDVVGVADRLASAGLGERDQLLAAMLDPEMAEKLGVPGPTLEGYLFPDTYDLLDSLSIEELLTKLVENYHRRVDPVFEQNEEAMDALRADLGFSERDVLVLASVVEKEAAVADERRTIAGVFLNRLRSPTFLPQRRLQSDPTVSYGCRVEPSVAQSCAGFSGTITRSMLEDSANRFNTYRIGGLPPTPIANPGVSAIEAVLRAEEHEYFYFVARGGRRHSFSTTLREHNEAVSDSRARGALP